MKVQLFYLIFISILLFNLSCEDNNKKFTAELKGKWTLINSGGTLHDVCPGEHLQFQDLFNCTSSCPNHDTVKMSYRFDPQTNVLTYIEPNVQYLIVTLDQTTLQLGGLGSISGRFLTYNRDN